MNDETKQALLDYLKSLEYYAATRGDGPFLLRDKENAEGDMVVKRLIFEKLLLK